MSEASPANHDTSPGSDDSLVPAATAKTAFEARAIATVLEADGIECVVPRHPRGWFGASINVPADHAVPVLVRRNDLDRAQASLEDAANTPIGDAWRDSGPGGTPPPAQKGSGMRIFFAFFAIIVVLWLILQVVT